MKTLTTEVAYFYTLIVEQENDSNVTYCKVIVTGSNRVIKEKVCFNHSNFDSHVKWAENCVSSHQMSLITSRAFNFN